MSRPVGMTKKLLPILFSLVGCVVAEADLETVDQELDGEWSSLAPECPSSDHWKITQAVRMANDAVRDPRMLQCLKSAILSYTESFPEVILDQLKLDVVGGTNVSCRDLGGAWGQGTIGIANEIITLDTQFLHDYDPDVIAPVIVHEVLHNRGYQHPQNNGSSQLDYDEALEYDYTVNEQAEACAAWIIGNPYSSVPEPNGPRREQFTSETRLAPTGWAGGTQSFSTRCPSGMVASGLSGRAHTYVDAVGLVCKNANGTGATQTLTPRGGSGGDPYTLQCGTNEILIGTYGKAASVNDRVGAICALASDVAAGTDTVGHGHGHAGGDGGHDVTRRCPARMAVTGIKGKYGNVIDRMELECRKVDDLDTIVEQRLAYYGDTHPNTETRELCNGRAALTGFTMHAGDRIDRLGGKCSSILNDGTSVSSFEYQLPAWGGTGGYVYEQDCASGEVVVGADIYWDSNGVNGIQPKCSTPTNWINGGASTRRGTFRGRAVGSFGSPSCARPGFVIGWEISTGTIVDGIRPICRTF
jgi:hypothetical protein